MKFAHMADVHIGAWREPLLATLPDECFDKAMSISLEQGVDFILIAGDLFDSALPGIDHLRSAVRTLQRAKEAKTPVYIIPGSHDYSASGKSMLGVLEEAGLVTDVFKGEVKEGKLHLQWTTDPSGVNITGILGRKGSLEKQHYEDLAPLELPVGKNIFMFHTSLDELKPQELSQMSSNPISMLPKGCDYYAGGHVHIINEVSLTGYPHVVYPGPVFPASFSELEKLGTGQLVIYDNGIKRIPIQSKEVIIIRHVADMQSPQTITDEVIKKIIDSNTKDKIVLVRISGIIAGGSIADLELGRIKASASEAYCVLRNTAALRSESIEAVDSEYKNPSELEDHILKEHSGSSSNPFGEDEFRIMKELLRALSQEKREGETNSSYEDRILDEADKVMRKKDV